MELGNIDLSSFTTPIEFSFNNLSEYKFGGVYIIFSINKNGIKQIVKIGESNFILSESVKIKFLFSTSLDEKGNFLPVIEVV